MYVYIYINYLPSIQDYSVWVISRKFYWATPVEFASNTSSIKTELNWKVK
jgi:hypothetical protein